MSDTMFFMQQFRCDRSLAERLAAARLSLSGMFNAGELAGLPEDTQLQLRGIELFLFGAADETREMGA